MVSPSALMWLIVRIQVCKVFDGEMIAFIKNFTKFFTQPAWFLLRPKIWSNDIECFAPELVEFTGVMVVTTVLRFNHRNEQNPRRRKPRGFFIAVCQASVEAARTTISLKRCSTAEPSPTRVARCKGATRLRHSLNSR